MISKAGFTKTAKDFMNDNGVKGRDLTELLEDM